MQQFATFEQIQAIFAPHGGTDENYLRLHFERYIQTMRRVLRDRNCNRGNRLLDVGAHWLHQSVLYAIDGFEVTALDLPITLETTHVRELAQAHGIRLLPNPDLEYPSALGEIPDDSFDLVLFTEVIEHLAFNPVAMWREIYRVMRPGARLVVTTPNYYALRSSARRWLRAWHGDGGAISVRDVLALKTLAHHWKEYSSRELQDYFSLLSPDFRCANLAYTDNDKSSDARRIRGKVADWLQHLIPQLRPGLYLEVDLPQKQHGITIEPHW